MNRLFQQAVDRLSLHPGKLFLIDGVGALLSAFLLGLVLTNFENIFGIPRSTLYFLAFIPCVFAVYDFFCYQKVRSNFKFYLKNIAYANLLYCGISMGLAFYHYQKITYLGWAYMLFEIMIVIALAILELKTANKQLPSPTR